MPQLGDSYSSARDTIPMQRIPLSQTISWIRILPCYPTSLEQTLSHTLETYYPFPTIHHIDIMFGSARSVLLRPSSSFVAKSSSRTFASSSVARLATVVDEKAPEAPAADKKKAIKEFKIYRWVSFTAEWSTYPFVYVCADNRWFAILFANCVEPRPAQREAYPPVLQC